MKRQEQTFFFNLFRDVKYDLKLKNMFFERNIPYNEPHDFWCVEWVKKLNSQIGECWW